jgi:hypothetical protein
LLLLQVLVMPPLTCLVALAAAAAANALVRRLQRVWQRRRPAHLIHPTLPELQRSWASISKPCLMDSHTLGAPFSRSSSSMTASGAHTWAVQGSSSSTGSSALQPSKPSVLGNSSNSSGQGKAAGCVAEASVDTHRDSKQAQGNAATFWGLTIAQVTILVLVVLQVQYPGLVYAALSTFNCITVPLPAATPSAALQQLWKLAGNGSAGEVLAAWPQAWQLSPVKLWVLDMNQECFAGYHLHLLLPVAVVGLWVWGLGLPAVTLAVALAARKRAPVAADVDGSGDGSQKQYQPLEVPRDPSFGRHEPPSRNTSYVSTTADSSQLRLFAPTPPPSDPLSSSAAGGNAEDSLGPFGMLANQQAAITSPGSSGVQAPSSGTAARSGVPVQPAASPSNPIVDSTNSSYLVCTVTELPVGETSLQPQLQQSQQHAQSQVQQQQRPPMPPPQQVPPHQLQKHLQNGHGARAALASVGAGKCGTVLEAPPGVEAAAAAAVPFSPRQQWAATVTDCLAGSYKAATKWWPAVQLLMLFVLVATAVFAAQAGFAMQPSFMLLVVLLMYCVTQLVKPHRNAVQGRLVVVVLAAFGLLLYAADCLAVCSGSQVAKMSEAQLLCTLQASHDVVAAVLLTIMVVPVVAMVVAMRQQLAWWCRWMAHCVWSRLPVTRHSSV